MKMVAVVGHQQGLEGTLMVQILKYLRRLCALKADLIIRKTPYHIAYLLSISVSMALIKDFLTNYVMGSSKCK